MIHLLNNFHTNITIIKQTLNLLFQKITVWKTKGNRQCLGGAEERACKQHRWASEILLSSIAKSKHFKTLSQAPKKPWNLLTIHAMWKITSFTNACIIVQAHSLPSRLSVVLPQQFWGPLANSNSVGGKSRELDLVGSLENSWVAGLGIKERKVRIARALFALVTLLSPLQLCTSHLQARQERHGSCRLCVELRGKGIFGDTWRTSFQR